MNNTVQQLRDHLSRRPNDGKAWLSLAQLLAQDPPGRELYHAIEQSIKSLPENYNAWLLAGNTHLRERGASAALVWLENTARQNPQLAAPRLALAMLRAGLYQQRGEWAQALRDYQEVEKKQRKDPVLLTNMGSCLASLERFDAAKKYFHKALRLDPGLFQARLNIGLLSAAQLNGDEAISQISEALKSPDIDPGTRQGAQTAVDILRDHKRLKPCLETAQRSASMGELQRALQQTSPSLLRPHQQTMELLAKLADSCRQIISKPEDFTYRSDAEYLPFIEACRQSKFEGNAAEMAQKFLELRQASATQALSKRDREILNAWNVYRDRQKYVSDLLQQQEGEAWLRYWHARLLQENPEKLPGLTKPVANAIGERLLTPPENVAGTFRELLAEIRPTVPAGLARGLFMLVAVNMIHGFGDGNGRLARFILNWELESVGLPAIIIPMSLRTEAKMNTNAAWDGSGVEPLLATFEKARTETGLLLRQFKEHCS